MQIPDDLSKTIDALNAIGLPTYVEPGVTGFCPGIQIREGKLYVDPSARVSGLLHEAGHLSCFPARFRHYVSDNIAAGRRRMFAEADDGNPDSPLYRALLQCSDPEATAWAYAFGTHLGFSPETIILDSEYAGNGEHVRTSLVARCYAGINGLAAAGFCAVNAMSGRARKLPVFPQLGFWLQTA